MARKAERRVKGAYVTCTVTGYQLALSTTIGHTDFAAPAPGRRKQLVSFLSLGSALQDTLSLSRQSSRNIYGGAGVGGAGVGGFGVGGADPPGVSVGEGGCSDGCVGVDVKGFLISSS